MAKLMDCLMRHWTSHPPVKSPEQIEAEKHLLCVPWFNNRYLTSTAIRFNRWILFGAAFVSQFCCGSLYAWSIYNGPIDAYIYGSPTAGKAVYAFYLACVLLGSAATLVGPWLERHGPKSGLLLGTTCFFVGYVIATISLACKSIVGVYIGYGVVSGFGIGVNYITPASALMKWFPDMRGTAAGFAVGGFGASSLLWSKVYLPAIDAMGLPGSFIFLGSIMSMVMYCCAIVMRTPPPGFTIGGMNMHGVMEEVEEDVAVAIQADQDKAQEQPLVAGFEPLEEGQGPAATAAAAADEAGFKLHQEWLKKIQTSSMLESLFSIDFLCIHVALLGNILFGLVVISRLSSMATGVFEQTSAQASTIVSINGAFTCTGQIVVPMISDLLIRSFRIRPPFARKVIYFCTLVTQLVIIFTMPSIMRSQNYTVFRIQVWILMICYGGAFGTVAAFLTDMFGAHNIAALHGCVLTAWSLAGLIGGLGFTLNFNHLVSVAHVPIVDAYVQNMHWIVAIVAVGLVALLCVRTSPADRFARGYQNSVCGKPIVRFGHTTP
ncbi:unnamed protein product [Aphanomyces euteiches]|nr:hypothetical protein AeRB84_016086 [Aphanomyces euteiches]